MIKIIEKNVLFYISKTHFSKNIARTKLYFCLEFNRNTIANDLLFIFSFITIQVYLKSCTDGTLYAGNVTLPRYINKCIDHNVNLYKNALFRIETGLLKGYCDQVILDAGLSISSLSFHIRGLYL